MRTLDEILTALRGERDLMIRATADSLGGSVRKALRIYLWEYASGRCAVCGLSTILNGSKSDSNNAEMGHLIPAAFFGISGMRCGFVPGNVAIMCHSCNSMAGDYVFTANDVIAECVPLEWPTLRKIRAGNDDHARMARQAREARGLPF